MSVAIRTGLAILAGSLTGTIWLMVSMSLLFYQHRYAVQIDETAFASIIHFILIMVVCTALGAPAYFVGTFVWETIASHRKEMRRVALYVSGVLYGFFLGMIGSMGYGNDFSTLNLFPGVASFGVAGIVTAATFLYIAEGGRIPRTLA